MIYVNLFLLAVIICFIIDCSGFNKSVVHLIGKILNIKIKDPFAIKIPFLTCSLCTVWWSSLIYLFIVDELSLMTIAYAGLLSLFSSNISGLLMYMKELLVYIENKLYKIIE